MIDVSLFLVILIYTVQSETYQDKSVIDVSLFLVILIYTVQSETYQDKSL